MLRLSYAEVWLIRIAFEFHVDGQSSRCCCAPRIALNEPPLSGSNTMRKSLAPLTPHWLQRTRSTTSATASGGLSLANK